MNSNGRGKSKAVTAASAPRRESPRGARARYWWLPIVLVAVLGSLTVFLWIDERGEEETDSWVEANVYKLTLARQLETLIPDRLAPIRRHWVPGKWLTPEGFIADAPSAINDAPDLRSLEWVDSNGICRDAISSERGVDDDINGKNVDNLPGMAGALERARGADGLDAGDVVADDRDGLVITFLHLNPISGHGQPLPDAAKQVAPYGGFLVRLRLKNVLSEAYDASLQKNFDVRIRDRDHVFFESSPAVDRWPERDPVSIRIADQTWRLDLWPNSAFLEGHHTHGPYWVLVLGLASSILVSASVFQVLLARRRDLEQTRRHVKALEALTEVSAAISADVGSGRRALEKLPAAARDLLRMSLAAVMVLEDRGQLLHILASSGIDPSPVGTKLQVSDSATARQCLQTGQVVVIDDAANHAGQLNHELVERFGIRSAMQIPLIIEGVSIGLMTLGDPLPRQFSEDEIRLARLWGAQAASALANARLYEQMSEGLEAQKKLIEQRAQLYAVTAEIYRPGTLNEMLQRVVEHAPALLEVDACEVNLVGDNPREIVVAAVTHPYAAAVGVKYLIRGTNTEQVLRTRENLVIEDGPIDPTLHPVLRQVLPSGSMVMMPLLRTDHKPIGTFLLLRHKPGPFTSDQLTLAKLLTVRMSAAIENAQLYQQTRRDADTKAMLLRELNHRVKNNLASIVSLLSMNEPDLSPEARLWLDRVVERIRTIGRTHELFSGGIERVSLAELVDQAVRSLSLVKPAGVEIAVDLNGVTANLTTERAVALAMVLHELCFNALAHGLEETGRLSLSAKRSGNDAVIRVVDDGLGYDPPVLSDSHPPAAPADVTTAQRPAAASRTGVGLSIVRGLVHRELRGRFSVISSPGGGTVATVEFPLLPEESTTNAL